MRIINRIGNWVGVNMEVGRPRQAGLGPPMRGRDGRSAQLGLWAGARTWAAGHQLHTEILTPGSGSRLPSTSLCQGTERDAWLSSCCSIHPVYSSPSSTEHRRPLSPPHTHTQNIVITHARPTPSAKERDVSICEGEMRGGGRGGRRGKGGGRGGGRGGRAA